MAAELVLEIVTPFGKAFSDTIHSCTIPGAYGEFQVLQNHAALVSLVSVGSVKIEKTDGTTSYMAVSGGYCEVNQNTVKVMAESAEFAEQIDVKRAEEAIKRAQKRLAERSEEIDADRARMALARAMNRLKVSQLR